MGIKVSGEDRIAGWFDMAMQIFSEEFKNTLNYIGEQAVSKARKDHIGDWKDYTCNLRSSIGYTVYEHGKKEILSAFEVVRKGDKEGTEGHNQGLKLVEELARKYSDTFVLVVVAGMDYASYVEAKENRDVLASATLDAMSKIDRYMNETVNKVVKILNSLKV